MNEVQGTSARANRKRTALTDAAVRIVATEGMDALTAERIATVAGVSRRTVFNYFDRVEDVLTASVDDLVNETIDAVIDRPKDEALRVALCNVLEGIVENPAFAQVRDLERAATTSPATRRFLLEITHRQSGAIEEGLHRRIGRDADPLYVSFLAGATSAVLDRATRLAVASARAEGADASRRHIALIRQAFDLLFDGFDEGAATSRTTTRSQES